MRKRIVYKNKKDELCYFSSKRLRKAIVRYLKQQYGRQKISQEDYYKEIENILGKNNFKETKHDTVSGWLYNNRKPADVKLRAIARELNVEVIDLMDVENSRNKVNCMVQNSNNSHVKQKLYIELKDNFIIFEELKKDIKKPSRIFLKFTLFLIFLVIITIPFCSIKNDYINLFNYLKLTVMIYIIYLEMLYVFSILAAIKIKRRYKNEY